jgi:catechol O-methyltransferase
MGKPRGTNPRAAVGVVKGGAIIALVRSFRETMAVALAAIKALRLGRRLPFLRWSVLRMILSRKRLLTEWQVGDGREQAALDFVLEHAAAGDIDAAIAALDRFSYERRLLINVGDEKGAILDAAVERVRPRCVLELGAYVGYSALRMARHLPESGSIISVELNPSNAAIAQRMIAHAGASHCIRIIVGSLGDGGRTLATLESFHGLGPGVLDFVFIDHAKQAYLADLGRILDCRWLRAGAVVVADNVGFPGAPLYAAYMEAEEGRRWRTRQHRTHAEYQTLIADIVLESTLLQP